MPVISVCNTKGGVGKTTLVICFADDIARQGYRVAVIDADPNAHVTTWKDLIGEHSPVTVLPGANDDNIQDLMDQAADEYDIVFVDLEGAASQLVLLAMSSSDLVLMPTRTSGMDLKELFRTFEAVKRASRATRRDIPARAIFSQIPTLNTNVTRHAREEVNREGIITLRQEIMMRPKGYGEIHYNGVTPAHPSGDDRAAKEIRFAVTEVLAFFQHQEAA